MSAPVLGFVIYNLIFPVTLDGRISGDLLCGLLVLRFTTLSSLTHQPCKTTRSVPGVGLGGVNIFGALYTAFNAFLIPGHL